MFLQWMIRVVLGSEFVFGLSLLWLVLKASGGFKRDEFDLVSLAQIGFSDDEADALIKHLCFLIVCAHIEG